MLRTAELGKEIGRKYIELNLFPKALSSFNISIEAYRKLLTINRKHFLKILAETLEEYAHLSELIVNHENNLSYNPQWIAELKKNGLLQKNETNAA